MEKKRVAMVGYCVLFIIFELLAVGYAEHPSNHIQENCTYTIVIETSCEKDAGTTDHVSLRFGDSNSNDVLVHPLNHKHVRRLNKNGVEVLDVDVPQEPFRPCGIDQFEYTGASVKSPVCYMYLKIIGKDSWRPGLAQVLVPGASHFSSETFYFRRFLPQHVWHGSDICDTKVTPFGIKHTRKVFPKKRNLKITSEALKLNT